MELQQLHYFITMAEYQHMTKAANKLMITQPSLSTTLSRLESEFGLPLFDRQGRNIILNDCGRIVLEHAKNIFREIDNIQTELESYQKTKKNTITIGSVDSIYVKYWLPFFLKKYPDIFVHHYIGSCADLESHLKDGTIDFAVTDMISNSTDFSAQFLGHDEYIILSPANNPIPHDAPQDFSKFKTQPFICSPKIKDILRPIDILSGASKFEPNIIFEGDPALLQQIFALDYGNVIVSKSHLVLPHYKKPFNIYYLKNESAHFNVNLIWDSCRTLSTSGQILIDYIKKYTTQFYVK